MLSRVLCFRRELAGAGAGAGWCWLCRYEQKGLPLHVLVMVRADTRVCAHAGGGGGLGPGSGRRAAQDMEWHEMYREPCYSTGAGFWGGYSWNKTLFTDPPAFVQALHGSRGPLTRCSPSSSVPPYLSECAHADCVCPPFTSTYDAGVKTPR